MKRLAILGSTRGTNLRAIEKAIAEKRLAASIEIVLSNKKEAFILERARKLGFTAEFIDPDGLSRESYDAKVSALLKAKHIDLIILVGYMRILSASFVNAWPQQIINIHPSLLPAFAGQMDLEVHRAVLAARASETGCSVHYVIEKVDEGPVLLQKKCAVYATDTPQTLKERVQALEGEALVEAIERIAVK